MDEDYPARPEIKQSLTGWGDNCGSESSTLETDVCVWYYAPVVVLATQEEEEEEEEDIPFEADGTKSGNVAKAGSLPLILGGP